MHAWWLAEGHNAYMWLAEEAQAYQSHDISTILLCSIYLPSILNTHDWGSMISVKFTHSHH